jgi:hypothetical protein
MALTPEEQSQVDIQVAVQMALENVRHANQAELQTKQAKLEAVRLAKETLVENARSKPVGERDIVAADVTAFADTLVAYVNA